MWKLLAGLTLSAVVIGGCWYAFKLYGWLGFGVAGTGWACGAALFVVFSKALLGQAYGKQFTFWGHSYDCCLMAMAGSVASLAVSIATNSAAAEIGHWVVFAAVTLVCTFLTGKIYQDMEHKLTFTAGDQALTCLGLLVGMVNLVFYLSFTVEKISVRIAGGTS